MAKFYGKIGFAEPVETSPGIWDEKITERPYFGDLVRNTNVSQSPAGVNNNVNISNGISVIADLYANQNSQFMRYVEFMGAKWQITNIEIQYPRIILTLGGIYNG